MATVRFVIFLVLAGALVLLVESQYEARRQLRSQGNSLQDQFKRIEQLEADNVRLSNSLARANTPLADAQLAELSELRKQVELLRHGTNEVATLRAEITRLRGALSALGSTVPADVPDVPAEDIHPRDSWEFAGYDTPENAIESLMWAVSQGDQDTYMAGLTPGLQSQMQTELADGSFAADGPFEMSDITGYRIVDRDVTSDNEVTVTLYIDGENDVMSVVLDKTEDGWGMAANE